MATVHIVGAGMAGLAAAVSLSNTEHRVVIHEAAGHAGGRCRSFHEDAMQCVIDNGNHLLLSGNTAVNGYLAAIGASDELVGPDIAAFDFVELPDGQRWKVRFDKGRIPIWILDKRRRIPGTTLLDYLSALRLANASPKDTLADIFPPTGELFRRFWEPLAVAILNTPAVDASAELLWAVVRQTFGQGAAACLPRIARRSLSETFVDPALAHLARKGVEIRFNRRVRELQIADARLSTLEFGDVSERLEEDDLVILAVPSANAGGLWPELDPPTRCHAIVNAHFRLEHALDTGKSVPILGLVGATAHWLFFRGDLVSATVSAADDLAERPTAEIARTIWTDVARAVDGMPGEMPRRHRIIKEKRATFSQTPESVRMRPSTRTRIGNLFLAGDWTDTGLPATIEGAIRSGDSAAEAILGVLR